MSLQAFFNRLGNPILTALLRSPLYALLGDGTMLVSVDRPAQRSRVYNPGQLPTRRGHAHRHQPARAYVVAKLAAAAPRWVYTYAGRPGAAGNPCPKPTPMWPGNLGGFLAVRPAHARYLGVSMRPDGTPNSEDMNRALRTWWSAFS